jgi:hypothetical protein
MAFFRALPNDRSFFCIYAWSRANARLADVEMGRSFASLAQLGDDTLMADAVAARILQSLIGSFKELQDEVLAQPRASVGGRKPQGME